MGFKALPIPNHSKIPWNRWQTQQTLGFHLPSLPLQRPRRKRNKTLALHPLHPNPSSQHSSIPGITQVGLDPFQVGIQCSISPNSPFFMEKHHKISFWWRKKPVKLGTPRALLERQEKEQGIGKGEFDAERSLCVPFKAAMIKSSSEHSLQKQLGERNLYPGLVQAMGKKGWNYCLRVCFPSEGRLRDILWISVDKAAGKAGENQLRFPGKC